MPEGVDVSSITCLEDIKSCIASIEQEEEQLEGELKSIMGQQEHLDTKISAFQQTLSSLSTMMNDSQRLFHVVRNTARLAESVSSKVKLLDLAKGRVYEAMKRVDDVTDLKNCVDGVRTSLQNGDYEKAADHVHRYLTLDECFLKETAKESEDAGGVQSAFQSLKEYEVQLKSIVRKRFDAAVELKNSEEVIRFLKLFPKLFLQEEGLTRFTRYLNSLISATSMQNLQNASNADGQRAGVAYADTLMLLYEGIARTVEDYQPLIEAFYGSDKMGLLMERLQEECDRQLDLIMKQYQSERLLEQKVKQVTSHSTQASPRTDPMQLDSILSEMALSNAHTELYFKFVRKKFVGSGATAEGAAAAMSRAVMVLKQSRTSLLMQELMSQYISIENFFLKETFSKALKMSTASSDGKTTSVVDDGFFIIHKCLKRAFSSCSVDGACAMLNHSCTLLMTEHKKALETRLKASFPSTYAGMEWAGVLQGKYTIVEPENSITTSLVVLNDIEVTINNIMKLTKSLQAEASKLIVQVGGSTVEAKLDSCVADLGSSAASFKELRETAITSVCETLLLPKFQPLVDVFSSYNHVLSEEDYSNYEMNDPFVQGFVSGADGIFSEVKATLLPEVFNLLLSNLTNEIAYKIEEQVYKCRFNQLGGVQFDNSLRILIGYFSSLTEWAIRDKFSRLSQMGTILNLEHAVEILDYWGSGSGPVVWRLTPGEVRRTLQLREDFKVDDINRIKL